MQDEELIERLRNCATGGRANFQASPDICREAADRLEALAQPVAPGYADEMQQERINRLAKQIGDENRDPNWWNYTDQAKERLAALAASPSPVVGDREAIAIPIPMVLHCPKCGLQHVDEPSEGWDNPPHRSHLCHGCGCVWRPADIATCGVASVSTQGSADNWTADAILSLSTPVVGGGADSLVDAATGGRFSNLTAFTEAMLSADDERSLDELVGEAATLLHALAGSLPNPHTIDRAGMAQD